jgi:serine protease inhibitor
MINPVYTDLVLANAIYFKGRWLDPFDAKLTKERPFHPAAGAAKNLPMMELSKKFTYREGSGYQAVRLPYTGDDLAMYVFLPDPGSSPAKLLQIMNGDNWRRVTLPGFKERDGLVVLPKFKLENTLELNELLKALGMKTAFNNQQADPAADFSEMFSDPHHLSEVRQKAFVEVSEEGTEAAAVTMMAVSAGEEMTQTVRDDCRPAVSIHHRGRAQPNDFVHGPRERPLMLFAGTPLINR